MSYHADHIFGRKRQYWNVPQINKIASLTPVCLAYLTVDIAIAGEGYGGLDTRLSNS